MSRGISKFEIRKIFKDLNNEDIYGNFFGVLPSNKINKLVILEKMMPEKNIYSFIISNTDREDQPDRHWQSILNKKIIKKVLKGIETMNRVDQKFTLQKLKFQMQGY